MPDKNVLTSDEIQKLRDFQNQFETITKRFGQLHFQQKLIEMEKAGLETDMVELENNRLDFMNTLQGKYGVGVVNIETGEFTSANPAT